MKALLRCGVLTVILTACLASTAMGAQMPVVFQEDFEGENPLAKWEPMDPSAWKIIAQARPEPGRSDGNKVLSMFKDSKFRPKVRSPRNFALIKGLVVGDFVMTLKMQSLTKDYGHRDLCLFFGYQSPTRYHYVHMALRADAHAHSIFIVDGKPRVTIIKERTKGLVWGDAWHTVKLERDTKAGTIKVYFDDMAKPIMLAVDKRLIWGRLGVGSFDDEGNYDDIVIRGIKVEPDKK